MADKKPRIRKIETVRDRRAKTTAIAEAKATKTPRSHKLRRATSKLVKPLRKPAGIAAAPFRLRPVKFTGRLVGRILWPKYFRNAYKEVRLVTWPGRTETWKLTFAVLVFAIAFGLLAAGTDVILDKIIRRIVFRS